MFGKSFKLFKLLGFQVKADISWLFIASLIGISFYSYFSVKVPGYAVQAYIYISIISAMLFFLSIIFHELMHSVVARKFDIPIEGITLFIFGGVSEMHDEPKSAVAEFLMAVAGPLSSFALSGIFHLLENGGTRFNLPLPYLAMFNYLSYINLILGFFNLLPAFPLDGGRVLRSIIWKFNNDVFKATKIASNVGKVLAWIMMGTGAYIFLAQHNAINGVWLFIIGIFIRNAAESSFRILKIRRAFESVKMRDFAKKEAVTVASGISVRQFVNDHVYSNFYTSYPVVDDGELKGCIDISSVSAIPKEEWEQRTVADIVEKCSAINVVSAEEDAAKAFTRMMASGKDWIMVVDGKKLLGIVTLAEMMRYINIKNQLEK